MRKFLHTLPRIVSLAVALPMMVAPVAHARSTIATAWSAYYDGSPGVASQSLNNMVAATTKTCQLCHELSSGGGSWNTYGWVLKQRIDAGRTNEQAFADVEPANSDGDTEPLLPSGWSNLLEIQFGSQPGWTYGDNSIYDGTGAVIGTATPPSGLTQFQIDPNPSVPVNTTTWGRLKRLYGE